MCLYFLYTFVCDFSHSKNNLARYYHKCALVFMYSTRYSRQILTKLEFSRRAFDKYSYIIYRKKTSSGSRALPSGLPHMTKVIPYSTFSILRTQIKICVRTNAIKSVSSPVLVSLSLIKRRVVTVQSSCFTRTHTHVTTHKYLHIR